MNNETKILKADLAAELGVSLSKLHETAKQCGIGIKDVYCGPEADQLRAQFVETPRKPTKPHKSSKSALSTQLTDTTQQQQDLVIARRQVGQQKAVALNMAEFDAFARTDNAIQQQFYSRMLDHTLGQTIEVGESEEAAVEDFFDGYFLTGSEPPALPPQTAA